MKVLHYYPSTDSMIASYVNMLTESMGLEAENSIATEQGEAREKLLHTHIDILHLHGCWRNSAARIVSLAQKQGTRIVLSPHGQLEPWVLHQQYWKEKMPKKWLYQRQVVSQAYAVVVQGRMEDECMRQLGWNARLVTVRNAVITHSITPREMSQQMWAVYRRVMDSNPLELMEPHVRNAIRNMLKAGITGDRRWVTDSIERIDDAEQWRHVLCYAHQEQVSELVLRGCRLLGYNPPDIDTDRITPFLPDGYAPSRTIQENIGLQFVTENDRLLATFRHLRKLMLHRRLTIMHLCELDRELRDHDAEEELLAESLREAHLYKLGCRMMWLLRDFTGFDEGMMPLPPLNGKLTQRIKQQTNNHLKI